MSALHYGSGLRLGLGLGLQDNFPLLFPDIILTLCWHECYLIWGCQNQLRGTKIYMKFGMGEYLFLRDVQFFVLIQKKKIFLLEEALKLPWCFNNSSILWSF